MALLIQLPLLPLVLLIVLFCTTSTGGPVNSTFHGPHPLDDASISNLLRRQNGIFSVLGIAGLVDSPPQPRREIRDLQHNYPDEWNVFLLGLQRFQSISQDDKLSYFQIAAIHGRPFVPWDGVAGDPYYWSHYSGYCTHDSILFTTWHRPFLALFEEVLYLNARQAVSELRDGDVKKRYLEALPNLRMPYWDWAVPPPSGEQVYPDSLRNTTINVVVANGTISIPNPLHSYRFRPVPDWEAEGEERWKLYPVTVRNPSSKDANVTSGNDQVGVTLDKNRESMQARVFNLLALEHDYLNMSTKLMPGDSIESIHGTIHDNVGMDGTMTWLFYSAFDPVFWLHHTNVDRLLAIWQTLNNNTWVGTFTNPSPTFAMPANFTVDSKTPLKPFHKDDSGAFWDSDDVRDWTVFGYTYPELIGLNPNSTLISRVNALYGPKTSDPHHSRKNKRGISTTGAPHFDGRRQYTLNVKVDEFRAPSSLKIYAFLGNVEEEDPTKWVEEAQFVGVTSIMAASKEGSQQANSIIPLTPALEAKVREGSLASMDESDVEEYLGNNLRWKVVQATNDITNCPDDDAPGLSLSVAWQKIEPARSSAEFPKPAGDVKELMCVEDGKKGEFPRLNSS